MTERHDPFDLDLSRQVDPAASGKSDGRRPARTPVEAFAPTAVKNVGLQGRFGADLKGALDHANGKRKDDVMAPTVPWEIQGADALAARANAKGSVVETRDFGQDAAGRQRVDSAADRIFAAEVARAREAERAMNEAKAMEQRVASATMTSPARAEAEAKEKNSRKATDSVHTNQKVMFDPDLFQGVQGSIGNARAKLKSTVTMQTEPAQSAPKKPSLWGKLKSALGVPDELKAALNEGKAILAEEAAGNRKSQLYASEINVLAKAVTDPTAADAREAVSGKRLWERVKGYFSSSATGGASGNAPQAPSGSRSEGGAGAPPDGKRGPNRQPVEQKSNRLGMALGFLVAAFGAAGTTFGVMQGENVKAAKAAGVLEGEKNALRQEVDRLKAEAEKRAAEQKKCERPTEKQIEQPRETKLGEGPAPTKDVGQPTKGAKVDQKGGGSRVRGGDASSTAVKDIKKDDKAAEKARVEAEKKAVEMARDKADKERMAKAFVALDEFKKGAEGMADKANANAEKAMMAQAENMHKAIVLRVMAIYQNKSFVERSAAMGHKTYPSSNTRLQEIADRYVKRPGAGELDLQVVPFNLAPNDEAGWGQLIVDYIAVQALWTANFTDTPHQGERFVNLRPGVRVHVKASTTPPGTIKFPNS